MAKTRKIQVTLDEVQYEQLAEIAQRENKKLARVVRESIVRYCIEPAAERRKQEALKDLLELESTPVPIDYAEWERDYTGLKVGTATPHSPRTGRDDGSHE